MSVINTNITSMIGQQNLINSKNALATSMERLSSGLRINSAKDDAAGQAIANRMSAQITGLAQAQRNANDGISVAQTAEGALNQVNDNLQRIRELSVQAQNGTNSQSDLESIQNEIGQRLNEINRISEETNFNGTKVLASDQQLSIQVGSNDGEAISISLEQINAETLGLQGFNVDGSGEIDNDAATADDLTLAGFTAGPTNANGSVTYTKDTNNAAATSDDLFGGLADATTASVSYSGTDTGLGVAATGNTYTYDSASDSFTFDAADAAIADIEAALTPGAGETTSATVTIGGSSQEIIIDSNGNITAADDGATLYLDATGNLTKNNSGTDPAATLNNLTSTMTDAAADDGDTIQVGDTVYTADGTTGSAFDVTDASISASGLQNLADAANGTTAYAVTLDGTTYDVEIGGAVENVGNTVMHTDADGALTTSTTTTTTYYAQNSGMVTDDTGAQVYKDANDNLTLEATTAGTQTEDPLGVLDDALSQVDALRSDLGAIQNRFESAITNLATTETNLSAARSRIEDADYATEVANMTRAQILQQAGTSVLAQANQIPQSVLSLLG